MGIDTKFLSQGTGVNRSWARYSIERNITIAREGTFPPKTTFFTIGSCFANEIRHALEKRSFAVLPKIDPSIHPLVPDVFKAEYTWGSWDERPHLQFYNTFSIVQEFEKAFGHWSQPDDDYIFVDRSEDHKYWDPYRRALATISAENFATLKNKLDQNLSHAIHNADACVMTLGMTETFFRRSNGLATCQYNRHFSDHADFRATTYEENLANLDRICTLYFGAYPERRIILSVSPVGLGQTFTDQDVVVANMESKSILRVAAAAIARKWPNVIYWPSFEIVLWNDDSWMPDLRHVHPDRVASIMDAFVEAHIVGTETNDSKDAWRERAEKIAAEVAEIRAEKMAAREERLAEIKRVNEEKIARREEALRLKEERIAAAREAQRIKIAAKHSKS